jgi:hypothetical protein
MSFEIGEKRCIVVKKDEIRLFEDGSSTAATFSYPRWALPVKYFDDIDNAVDKLTNDEEEIKCVCTSAPRGTCR